MKSARRHVDVGALPGVGQELVDVAWREGGEAGQDAGQVALRVELVALGACDQRIQQGCGAAGAVIPGKQPVFSSDRHPLQRPFGRIVVDIEKPFARVRVEGFPLVKRVCKRLAHRAARQDDLALTIEPGFDVGQDRHASHLTQIAALVITELLGIVLDGVQRADEREHLRGALAVRVLGLEELAARMRPAGDFNRA